MHKDEAFLYACDTIFEGDVERVHPAWMYADRRVDQNNMATYEDSHIAPVRIKTNRHRVGFVYDTNKILELGIMVYKTACGLFVTRGNQTHQVPPECLVGVVVLAECMTNPDTRVITQRGVIHPTPNFLDLAALLPSLCRSANVPAECMNSVSGVVANAIISLGHVMQRTTKAEEINKAIQATKIEFANATNPSRRPDSGSRRGRGSSDPSRAPGAWDSYAPGRASGSGGARERSRGRGNSGKGQRGVAALPEGNGKPNNKGGRGGKGQPRCTEVLDL